MILIKADKVVSARIEHFLKVNEIVNRDHLLESGYVVSLNDEIIGCFILETIEADIYWLKQLYIIESEAMKLPILLETILNLAKKQEAKRIFVHSHQLVVDLLLKALQFYPQKGDRIVDQLPKSTGNWWSYNVS